MTQWSPQQDKALKDVAHWLHADSKNKQVYRLFGCAGTGKTTLARHLAENVTGLVKFATFTGKAAHVMASKGCVGATTIHRLIYRPKASSKFRLKELEKKLMEVEFEGVSTAELQKLREEIKQEQENAGRMSFSLNLESELRFAKLLVIDEASMCDATIGKDLESFKIPILVLGDPEQLPPIYGSGYFTDQEPDTMLTEIHRQALDNPIIKMSQLVRSGEPLQIGSYGSSCVINKRLDPKEILQHDMILTGLRKTKRTCDERSRNLLNKTNRLPMSGDRIMCVKNNHDLGLLNGQIWEMLTDSVPTGGGIISIHIKNVDSDEELVICASEKLFYGESLSRWEHEDDIQEFEYAYAMTVHKAQGSQWDKVLLFDQRHCFPQWSQRNRQRWLYTGITRAAESLTVMRLE